MKNILLIVLIVVLFIGIANVVTSNADNVKSGFNMDLNNLMDNAISGNSVQSDNPFHTFTQTGIAIEKGIDEGYSFLSSILTVLALIGIGVFIVFVRMAV